MWRSSLLSTVVLISALPVKAGDIELYCKYSGIDGGVRVMLMPDLARAVYFYGSDVPFDLEISADGPKHLKAHGDHGLFVLNKVSGQFAYAFADVADDGDVFGNIVRGYCDKRLM